MKGEADEPTLSLLYPQSAPNEPVVLYDGKILLRHGAERASGTGSVILRWFPSSEIRLDFILESGVAPKLGSTVTAELGNLQTEVQVFSRSIDLKAGVMSKRISGFISSMRNLDTSTLASLRFQIINFIDFLTPGLVAVPGDPATVGMRGGLDGTQRTETQPKSTTIKAAALRHDPWEINLVAVPNSTEIYRSLKETGGYAFTHVGQVKRTDGALFSTSEVASVLSCLSDFLSLARGAACSLPLRWGIGSGLEVVWREFGSPIVDTWKETLASNWFDRHHGNLLAELFSKYFSVHEHPAIGEPFRLALHWYRHCNTRAGGMEGALILGVTALELLSALVVVDDAGVITASKHDKLRTRTKLVELLKAVNVEFGIPSRYENLIRFANENEWQDASTALTELRHGLVHPNKSRRQVVLKAGLALFEAWQLSLWYQELALLYLLKHNGDYMNRVRAGWVGQVEPVPWASGGGTRSR